MRPLNKIHSKEPHFSKRENTQITLKLLIAANDTAFHFKSQSNHNNEKWTTNRPRLRFILNPNQYCKNALYNNSDQ